MAEEKIAETTTPAANSSGTESKRSREKAILWLNAICANHATPETAPSTTKSICFDISNHSLTNGRKNNGTKKTSRIRQSRDSVPKNAAARGLASGLCDTNDSSIMNAKSNG